MAGKHSGVAKGRVPAILAGYVNLRGKIYRNPPFGISRDKITFEEKEKEINFKKNISCFIEGYKDVYIIY